MKQKELNLKAANNLRILALSMVEKAKSGHPGGAMGGADYAHILYSQVMTFSPEHPDWFARDRFFLDPGHMSPMLYSVLSFFGKYTMEDLKNFRQWDSVTPGHPERDIERGVENTSGPLGQGHTYAVGAAIAAKKMQQKFGSKIMRQRIYSFISDGGIQEEVSQGAGRIAGHLGLDNLIMFYDSNDVQLSTMVDDVTSEDVAMKYKAWGWEVIEIDGNDHGDICDALAKAHLVKGKPTLIIGKTIMGKGALAAGSKSFERMVSTHGQPLTAAGAALDLTIEALGGKVDDPFVIFDDVQELYDKRKEELNNVYNAWEADYKEWRKAEPDLAKELDQWLSNKPPKVDWAGIEQKPNQATRAASATVLGHLAKNVPNIIVSSADLCNSDKTDGFLKASKEIVKGDFSGGFLQAGVSEFTMACICIGIALHGGIIPACGTFFVFSDYQKPALRMATLMGVPVIFIWTHDAFRVGEDGPTHEPVEQEAQIRLLEKIKNHHGHSLLALRPADVHETTVAWQMAIENVDSPTTLILSRQNINDLPENDYKKSKRATKGAYTVISEDQPDVVMVASGSEVSTLVEGAERLKKAGIKANVVSVPSEGLFRSQTAAYQKEVLPEGIVRFGLTAGLPVNLQGLVGENGAIWGLETFGYSAPYKVLDEKLGFTAENVEKQVKKLLKK